jgi:glycosyltransferase involved in cell wall biosynthesis
MVLIFSRYIPAYAIGRAMAETDIYNAEFVKSCNTMDEIWVPSKFSLDVLRDSGVIVPIRIVPIAVNTTLFDPFTTQELKHLPIGDLVMGQHRRLSPSLVVKRNKDQLNAKMEELRNNIRDLEDRIAQIEVDKNMLAMLKENLIISKPGGGVLSREEVAKVVEKRFRKGAFAAISAKFERSESEQKKEALLKSKEELVVLIHELDLEKDNLEEGSLLPGLERPSALLQIVKSLKPRAVQKHHSAVRDQKQGDETSSRRLKPFCFISTFKWEERKGWKTLLSAYLREFSSDDDVELYILTKPFSNFGTSFDSTIRTYAERQLNIHILKGQPWWVDSAAPVTKPWSFWSKSRSDPSPQKTSYSSPALYIISNHLSNEEYAQMYKSCQAYVSPSRGEGWGMPVTEAMSMGLPVLVTNWSGLVDFVDDSVGRMLNYTLQPIPRSKTIPWWFWEAKWAEVDVADLRRAMREAYEQPELTRAKGRAARKRMETLYSPAAVARVVATEVERIRRSIRSGEIEGYQKDFVLAPNSTASENSAMYTGFEPFATPGEGSKGLWSCRVCVAIIWAVVALDVSLLAVVFLALVGPCVTKNGRMKTRGAFGKAYKESPWSSVTVCP